MRGRFLAFLWLVVVMAAGGHLAWRAAEGLHFRTDLTALLPREDQDPVLQRANDTVTRALSQQVVLLVGAPERRQARAAAAEISHRLDSERLVDLTTSGLDKDRLQQMGRLYFPYRSGLLAEDDRHRLMEGKAQDIASRALSQVYGFVGMADARLLHQDPFLLMPAFFAGLPLPQSKLSLDDGMMSLNRDGETWILVAGRLTGEPFALDVQQRLGAILDQEPLQSAHPGVTVLRLGAVFFARAGADQALTETSQIGLLSTLGTILLVVLIFRALSPLWLSLLVIGVGIMTALSASLWLFGELHVGALLFGVSLIGVAVDYSLQYCTEIFAPAAPPFARLRRVLMGITLGTATTIIGYLTLFLAPFPGLHQIAFFSTVGLVAAWMTVVLWLPLLDLSIPPRHGRRLLAFGSGFLAVWEQRRYGSVRIIAITLLAGAALMGLPHLHADDDVRHMQSLSGDLLDQQRHILDFIGDTAGGQFFLVQAADAETALQREEALIDALRPVVAEGSLRNFQALARYVPSAARQHENRLLVRTVLEAPLLAHHLQQLHLDPQVGLSAEDEDLPVLTPDQVLSVGGPLGFLSLLRLEGAAKATTYVVTLEGVTNPERIARVGAGLPNVRFVDPVANFTALLGKYRNRAIWLIALSAALMAPLLIWRHGFSGGMRLLVPPLLAVVLTPALRSLGGAAFTFFDAMALVLVLSVGVDYAVFCAETVGERRPVTMVAIAMAACTALMSFGLLALSNVAAVHAFGSTMSLGILLAFLLSPMARKIDGQPSHDGPSHDGHWARLAEHGTYLGMRLIRVLYGVAGRRGCIALLWLIVPYFYFSDKRRRRHSLDFLGRVRARQGLPPPGWRDGLGHFMSFAEKALDTFIAWSCPERTGTIRTVGAETIEKMSAEGRGGLLIVSHLGNADVCRAHLAKLFGRRINVLLHTRHAVHYNRILNAIHPSVSDHTIQVTEIGPETAIDLKERVERGEWVAIAGDRTPVLANTRISRVPFFGHAAAFSQGPYILASLLACPVQLIFCLREGDGFTVYFETFSDGRIRLPHRGRDVFLEELCARYANVLERYCLKMPQQWYNFFDFWA
jgi:predicted exporter/predicted LPLAT superfamily acyltransferase